MAKHLTIEYDGATLWDGPVGSFQWSDDEHRGITVQAKPPGPPPPGAGQAIKDAISKATSKASADATKRHREEVLAKPYPDLQIGSPAPEPIIDDSVNGDE